MSTTDLDDRWDQVDWDQLLEEIDKRKVVPVIGADLLTVGSGSEERDLDQTLAPLLVERLYKPLKQHYLESIPKELAEQAANAFRIGTNGDGPRTVAQVAAAFMRSGAEREVVYSRIRDIVKELDDSEIPTPLRQLAEISSFKLFVTTTFDGWLSRALVESRGEPPQTVWYSPKSRDNDLPKDHALQDIAFVYHVLGGAESSDPFAVTDEDMLEFVHRLQGGGGVRVPSHLLNALQEYQLLLIGCRLPDWLTRFLIRIAKGKRLISPESRRQIVAGGSVEGEAGEVLESFLEAFAGNTTVLDDGAAEFVEELHRRWTERNPDGPPAPPPPPEAKDKVFLSYSHADTEKVRPLKEALQAAKLSIWFDEDDLKGGDEWNAKIKRNIRGCALFVPVISANVFVGEDKYFRKEWKWAADRQEGLYGTGGKIPFILPVCLDDTGEEHEMIPEAFTDNQWMRPDWSAVEDGRAEHEAHAAIAEQVVKKWKQLQKARREGVTR